MNRDINAAGIYILDLPFAADREYSYSLPYDLRSNLRPGCLVCVPFGKSNKLMTGVVSDLYHLDDRSKLKAVYGRFTDTVIDCFSDEMMKLAFFMKDNFFCSVGEALRAMLPSGTMGRVDIEYYAIPDLDTSELPLECLKVYEHILVSSFSNKDGSGVFLKELQNAFGVGVDNCLSLLCTNGYIRKSFSIRQSAGEATLEFVELISECNDELMLSLSRSRKQKDVVKYLSDFGSVSMSELRETLGVTRQVILSLEKKGIVEINDIRHYRSPYASKSFGGSGENILNDEQRNAYETISGLIDSSKAAGVLLHGVTGSGKTRVMKEVIDKVISKGKSVIVLVPEISLTPQTVSIFSSYYGNDIAVIHSALSTGEKFDEWQRIYEGKAKICIGTRSAVFAPFKNLGLIIIDEEQEHTFKSDSSPRYHARDVARFRCAYHSALMLLSSATPSVESYYKAKNNQYTLVELKERYSKNPLPETFIYDMRGHDAGKPIGELLRINLAENMESSEQSIIFMNRRGFSNYASCTLCGNIIKCPNCSVSLTYHTKDKTPVLWADSPQARKDNGYLLCHYCGYKRSVPDNCPECGNKIVHFIGYGTQFIEKEIKNSIEQARVIRLDADTTKTKFSFDELLGAFRRGEGDILLGTQMVAKGHDFPNVTLVGVINADCGFGASDYRAAERTFSLITQVIGRAGRAGKKGRAIIQTSSPDSKTIRFAASQNYRAFYENEIAVRHALVFPPFCDIAALTLTSADEKALLNLSDLARKKVKELLGGEFSDVAVQVFGPLEAPIFRLREKMRMKLIIKCKANKRTRAFLSQLLSSVGKLAGNNVTVHMDINPTEI